MDQGLGIEHRQKMLAFRCCSSTIHESGALLLKPELRDLATEEFGDGKTPGRLRGFRSMVNNALGPDGLPRRTPVAQRVMDDLRKQMEYLERDRQERDEAADGPDDDALGAFDVDDDAAGYGGGEDDGGYTEGVDIEVAPAEAEALLKSPGPEAREVEVVEVKQKRKGGRRVRFAEDGPDPWAELDPLDESGAGSGVEGGKPMRRAKTWRKTQSFEGTSLDDAAVMLWGEELARGGGTGAEIQRPPVPGDRGAGVLGAAAFPEFAYMYDAMRRRKRVAAMANARASSLAVGGGATVQGEEAPLAVRAHSRSDNPEEEDAEDMERLRAIPAAGTSFEDAQIGGYGGDEDAWGGGGPEAEVVHAEADEDEELPPVALDFDGALAEAYKEGEESSRIAEESGMSYEQLVKLHVEKYVASCVLKASGVQMRVSAWKEKITPAIKMQEDQGTFDLNGVSDALLTQLKVSSEETDTVSGASTTDMAHLLESSAGSFDVSRKFVSMLQLINSENISLQVQGEEIATAHDESALPPILGEGAARVLLLRDKREGPDIEKIVLLSSKERVKNEQEAELKALQDAKDNSIREDEPPSKQSGRGRSSRLSRSLLSIEE